MQMLGASADMPGNDDRVAEDTNPPVLVSVPHVSAVKQRFFARIVVVFLHVLVVARFLSEHLLCNAAHPA